MLSIKTGIRPEEIRFKSQHVLFVEGSDRDSVDPTVLKELFDQNIKIEVLGPSFSVKSVAEALFRYHPTYYFLIDRDHHNDEFIDKCWSHFPDPATHNLLVWRRREIENYFLDPEYLFHSNFCRVSQEKLQQKILQCAKKRLFIDAANYVVVSIREELKKNWITKFTNSDEFPSKSQALKQLQDANEFEQHRLDVNQKVSFDEIEQRFNNYLSIMTGERDDLVFGVGNWLHMIQGKKILVQVINSECFQVEATDGTSVHGRFKINEVVKELLKKSLHIQPKDFVHLKRLIEGKINESRRI